MLAGDTPRNLWTTVPYERNRGEFDNDKISYTKPSPPRSWQTSLHASHSNGGSKGWLGGLGYPGTSGMAYRTFLPSLGDSNFLVVNPEVVV